MPDANSTVDAADAPLILVVEDDPSVRTLIGRILELANLRVVAVETGATALDVLREQRPELVILDNGLPDMPGLAVLVTLRSSVEWRTLPVILLTGDDAVADRVRGLQAGATDYVGKPFDPDELVARVTTQLRHVSAWASALENDLARRAEAVQRLSALPPAHHAAEAAQAILDELHRFDVIRAAAIVLFAGPNRARVIASVGIDLSGDLPGQAAISLVELARQGSAVARLTDGGDMALAPLLTPGRPAVAIAPLLLGQPVGVLAVVAVPTVPGAPGPEMALTTAIEFAPLVANTLGPLLAQWPDHDTAVRRVRAVIDERAFAVHFQPVIDLNTRRTVGFEALSRFAGVAPADFFTNAARVGLGPELELTTAMVALEQTAPLDPRWWLSVNVSPDLVLDGARFEELLAATIDRPVVLEITEHVPVADYDALLMALAGRPPNVQVAVDDAGAGYATMTHVLALRPDQVKLDVSWVRDIDRDDARQALVAGMTLFGQRANCTLIAEGIERTEELLTLQALEVTLGQGYLLGRPSPHLNLAGIS